MGSMQSLPEAHFYILLALADSEKHGYAVMQDVEQLTNGKTRLSPGTLYGAIQRMLEAGLIEEVTGRSAADDRRRTYRITRDGRNAAAAEMKRLETLLERARHSGLAPKRSGV